jgi:hypothetical protein
VNIDNVTWRVDLANLDRLIEFGDEDSQEDFRQVLETTANLPFEHYIIYNRSRDREISGYLSLLSLKECVILFFRSDVEISSLEHIEDKINAETIFIPTNASLLDTALANKYRDAKNGNSTSPELESLIPEVVKAFYQFDGKLVEKELFHNTLLEKFRTYIYVFKRDHLKRVSEISQWVLLLCAGFVQGVVIPNLMDYLGAYKAAGLASLFLLAIRPIISGLTNPNAAERVDRIPKEKYVFQHFKKTAKKIVMLYSGATVVLILLQKPILDFLPVGIRVPFAILGISSFLALDTWAYMNVTQQHFGMIRHVLSETPRFKQHCGKYVQDNAISQSISMLLFTSGYLMGFLTRHISELSLLIITGIIGIPFAMSKLGIVLSKPRYALEVKRYSDVVYYLIDRGTVSERYLYSFDIINVDAIEDTMPYVTIHDDKYMIWINGETIITFKKGNNIEIKPYHKNFPLPFAEKGKQKILCADDDIVIHCYRKAIPVIEYNENKITLR